MSLAPPLGTPAYDSWAAENKGPWIVITCWVVTGISTLFVAARIYVRGFIHRKLQQDDYWSILAQICGYISTALSTVAVASGNGRHFELLSKEQKEGAILWTTAAFCPGVISFGLPKLAVIYLLTKLLNPNRYHKMFLWWQGIWCQLTLFATVGVLIGRCRPAYSLWTLDVEGECFSNDILIAYCVYAGCFSAFVDLYLAIYPAVVLFKLQMTIKKKIALSMALGIGSVSGVVAIYKTTRIPSLGSPDFSYDTSDLVVWTVIEGSTIMIASAIPILQPLLEKILGSNPFSSYGKNSRGQSRKYPERYYENYSDGKSGNYELNSRPRRGAGKPKDDLGLTILADDSSQEEILAASSKASAGTSVAGGPQQTTGHGVTVGSYNNPGKVAKTKPNQIMRTDVVTVTYNDESSAQTANSPKAWKPIP